MPYKDPEKKREHDRIYHKKHRQEHLDYGRKYYQDNKEEFSEYSKQHYLANTQAYKDRANSRYIKYRDRIRAYQRKYMKSPEARAAHNACVARCKIRDKRLCIEHYSNGTLECACCKKNEYDFLTIDHINGGGRKHRAQIQRHLYSWLRNKGFPDGYRILCMECNWAFGKLGYCPHQKKKNVAASIDDKAI